MAMSRSFGGTSLTIVAADEDVAAGDVLEARDHAQRRRLAAARRADEHHELVVGDLEVDAAHRLDLIVLLDDLAQRDFRHGRISP